MAGTTIVVLEGDETGQELLEEALRVLAPDVIGARGRAAALRPLARSRGARPRTPSCTRRRAAVREAGLGLKGATVTPEGAETSARRTGSSAPSGVTVAAFRPSPASRTAAAASCTIAFFVARRDASERSKRGRSRSSADHVGREHPQRLVEQLLPGLVALEDDDRLPCHRRPPWIRTARPRLHRKLYGPERRMEAARLARRFRYEDARGRPITDEAALERIAVAGDPARPGGTSGSRRAPARSCRRPASTRPDGASTSTTRNSARARSRRSSTS